MTTAPLVELLDSRYGTQYKNWCIYRAATGEWVVLIQDQKGKSITGATIEEALANAVKFKPIPEIPRRPREMNAEEFEPRKSGKFWHIYYGDQFFGVLKSKRDCKKVAPKIVERSLFDARQWDAKYGQYLTMAEGIDYRFRDH